MSKKSKKNKSKEFAKVETLDDNTNVFSNPEDASVEGSATQLSVLDGNKVMGPDEDEIADPARARQVLDRVSELFGTMDEYRWELAQCVYEVHAKKYCRLLGFPTFEAYTQSLGKERRDGYYYVSTYSYFYEKLRDMLAEAPKSYQKILDMLPTFGWSKARLLASAQIINPENALEVMKRASEGSFKDLQMACRAYRDSLSEKDKEDYDDANTEKTLPMRFQLYLSQESVVSRALDHALQMMKPGAKKSHALTMICQDFLSSRGAATGRDVAVAEYCSEMERVLDLQVVAIDEAKSKVMYGAEYLKRLAADDEKPAAVRSIRPDREPGDEDDDEEDLNGLIPLDVAVGSDLR